MSRYSLDTTSASTAGLLRSPGRGDVTSRYRQGLRFLLTHLRPDEESGGSLFECGARSRALESALLLDLLRKERMRQDWQRRLTQYLMLSGARADGLSRLISSAVIEAAPTKDAVSPLRQLIKGLEYGKRRKEAMLVMMLVQLDLLSFEEARVTPEDFAEQATHRFSQLYCSALRLMYHRRSQPGPPPQVDVEFLLQCQASNGSWEQQTLITLLAMMGLGAEERAFFRGLEFLESVEREDGGIPFIDNQNVWVTSLAGLALQAGGALPDVQEQLCRYIVSRQRRNGGWTFTDGVYQTDTDDAANCVQVLLQRDPARYAPQVERALEYFRELQRDDGGFPTYEREGDSEVTMTANILLVQSLCVRERPELMPALRAASRFLLARQRSDGRFEKSWSLSETYSIFRVLWALEVFQRVDGERPAVDAARSRSMLYLLESQHTDGGWGQGESKSSDALSTAYGLSGLSLLREHFPIEPSRIQRATQYLLSQQDPDSGEFVSIPDVAGPRPIPFDVPLLSTVFSLMALSFAQSDR